MHFIIITNFVFNPVSLPNFLLHFNQCFKNFYVLTPKHLSTCVCSSLGNIFITQTARSPSYKHSLLTRLCILSDRYWAKYIIFFHLRATDSIFSIFICESNWFHFRYSYFKNCLWLIAERTLVLHWTRFALILSALTLSLFSFNFLS